MFDLDGTLIDNTQQILDSFIAAFDELGVNYDHNVVKSLMGMSLHEIGVQVGVPERQMEDLERLYIREISKRPAGLYHGIRELLENLKKTHTLGVVTSKLKETTEKALLHNGIEDMFSVVITSPDVSSPKPSPEGILLLCKRLNISPSKDIVYIGDRQNDMLAAKRAGIAGIAVNWGVDKWDLEDVSVCRSVEQLQALLGV
ncbi:MAG: HAD family hydrolase [Candidatus Kariarchaeaceae archaeon]